MTRLSLVALLAVAGAGPPADLAPPPRPATPVDRMHRLVEEYDRIEPVFREGEAVKTEAERVAAIRRYEEALRGWRVKAVAAVRAAVGLPEAPPAAAEDEVVAARGTYGLVRRVQADRPLDRPENSPLFLSLVQAGLPEATALLEEAVEGHPDPKVRGQAALALGWFAKWRVMQDGEHKFGFGKRLTGAERERWEARGEKYLTLAAETYPAGEAVGLAAGRVGPVARAERAGLRNLSSLQVGKTAPDLAGDDLDGRPFKLSDQRGKVAVVVFWASWCGPCLKMVPQEKELTGRLKGRPFVLVGVNGDDDPEKARQAAEKHGMTWPSVRTAGDIPVAPSWCCHKWPTVYVIDAKRVIRFIDIKGDELDKAVDGLLEELEAKK